MGDGHLLFEVAVGRSPTAALSPQPTPSAAFSGLSPYACGSAVARLIVFGYGSEAHGAGARGVMLTAWRHEMGRGWSPEGAEDVNSTAGV